MFFFFCSINSLTQSILFSASRHTVNLIEKKIIEYEFCSIHTKMKCSPKFLIKYFENSEETGK